jgi:hypothetical protein
MAVVCTTHGGYDDEHSWTTLCHPYFADQEQRDAFVDGRSVERNVLSAFHGIIEAEDAQLTTVDVFAHLYGTCNETWSGMLKRMLQEHWVIDLQYYSSDFERRERVLFGYVGPCKINQLRTVCDPSIWAPPLEQNGKLYTMVMPGDFLHVLPMPLSLLMRCLCAYIEGIKARAYQNEHMEIALYTQSEPYERMKLACEKLQIIHVPPRRIEVRARTWDELDGEERIFIQFLGASHTDALVHVTYCYPSGDLDHGVYPKQYVRDVLARSFMGAHDEPVIVVPKQ